MTIIVREYTQYDKVEYPPETLPEDFHVEPMELSLPNIHGDCILFRDNGYWHDKGYDVHHVQSLPVTEHYVRGLIEHDGQMYVFTARMKTQNVGLLDWNKLVEEAIEQLDFNKKLKEDEDELAKCSN